MCILYGFLVDSLKEMKSGHDIKIYELLQKGKKRWKTLLIIMGIIVLFCSVTYIYAEINPLWKEYQAANKGREYIYDYRDRYPNVNENKELYLAHGADASIMKMIHSNLTGDENVFTSENLGRIVELRGASSLSVKDLLLFLISGPKLWIVILVLVFYTIVINWQNKKRIYIPFGGNFLGVLLCSIFLMLIGRIAWRVLYGVILAAVICYLLMIEHGRDGIVENSKVEKGNAVEKRRGIEWLFTLGALLCCVLVALGVHLAPLKTGIKDSKIASLLEYMDSQEGTVYLLTEGNLRYYSGFHIWAAPNVDFLDNVYNLRAHFILGQKEELNKFGITNPIRDLLTKPDIYSIYNPTLWVYLRNHYDKRITVSIMDEFEDTEFVRYAVPIEKESTEYLNINNLMSSVWIEQDDETEQKLICVSGELPGEVTRKYLFKALYLNVTNHHNNDIYSYCMVQDKNNHFSGKGYWMENTEQLNDLTAVLIGETEEGDTVVISQLYVNNNIKSGEAVQSR